MNKYQNMILWIGLALVLVYIFASHGILTSVFAKPASTAAPGPALTLKDFGSTNTGNGQSNTNNQGSVKTTVTLV
jgi:hypothetical protein